LTTEAALVCFSRVYVGGHYPFDVIGGILLGTGIAFIFVAMASTKRGEKILQQITIIIQRCLRVATANPTLIIICMIRS
jgi:membrane-associated phospholipid phosphatase